MIPFTTITTFSNIARPSCFLYFTAGTRCAQGGEPHGKQKAQRTAGTGTLDKAHLKNEMKSDITATTKDAMESLRLNLFSLA